MFVEVEETSTGDATSGDLIAVAPQSQSKAVSAGPPATTKTLENETAKDNSSGPPAKDTSSGPPTKANPAV